jgi:hypothetical protein
MGMRPARLILGTALALALAWPARGEDGPARAFVQTDGAQVRCQPGDQPAVYLTHLLRRGDPVQVVEKLDGGWLKIEPPDGSFSWINTRFLHQEKGPQPIWTVSVLPGASAPVLVGSPFKEGHPDVMGTRVARGAQVIAVGEPRAENDGLWLPIQPPAGEYRYVRQADVAATPPASAPGTATATTAAHAGSAAALAAQATEKAADAPSPDGPPAVHVGIPVPSSSPAAPPRPVSEPDALYQQARQFEQAGNRAEASRAYDRLGDLYRDGDRKLARQYYDRASWLRQALPAAPAGPDGRVQPASAVAAVPPGGGAARVGVMSAQMAGPGRLMRSAYWIDGRPTYVLENPQAQVMAYLTPQPGVDLERYTGQNVSVLGQIGHRADVQGQYMAVARVLPLTTP